MPKRLPFAIVLPGTAAVAAAPHFHVCCKCRLRVFLRQMPGAYHCPSGGKHLWNQL